MTAEKRDWKADLAICEAATEGPWVATGTTKEAEDRGTKPTYSVTAPGLNRPAEGVRCMVAECGPKDDPTRADAIFIAAARTGWPAAIREAMRVEGLEAERDASRAEVGELREVLRAVMDTDFGADPVEMDPELCRRAVALLAKHEGEGRR